MCRSAEMKLLALLIFVAANLVEEGYTSTADITPEVDSRGLGVKSTSWVTRSDAVTCADMTTCLSEMSQLSDDQHEESCRLLGNITNCLREAIGDCRRSSTLSKEKEDQFNLILSEAVKKCGSRAGTASQTVSIFLLLLHCSILLLFSPLTSA